MEEIKMKIVVTLAWRHRFRLFHTPCSNLVTVLGHTYFNRPKKVVNQKVSNTLVGISGTLHQSKETCVRGLR